MSYTAGADTAFGWFVFTFVGIIHMTLCIRCSTVGRCCGSFATQQQPAPTQLPVTSRARPAAAAPLPKVRHGNILRLVARSLLSTRHIYCCLKDLGRNIRSWCTHAYLCGSRAAGQII